MVAMKACIHTGCSGNELETTALERDVQSHSTQNGSQRLARSRLGSNRTAVFAAAVRPVNKAQEAAEPLQHW